jgi:hypothetical protein
MTIEVTVPRTAPIRISTMRGSVANRAGTVCLANFAFGANVDVRMVGGQTLSRITGLGQV